jgi:hypothetical protein
LIKHKPNKDEPPAVRNGERFEAGGGDRREPRLKFRYCGGCNPVIDRTALADALRAGADEGDAGKIVYISGCSRACASNRALTSDSPDAVIVAGEHVDGERTAEAQIAAAVRRKLKE